jgi:glycosyltransferase involved in cell wall biosynthesis
VRKKLGLEGRFVFGWTGSFRKFHGLDIALHAFGRILPKAPDAILLLVGDGPERAALERIADEVGARQSVVFSGSVPHTKIAEHVGAMDATLVVARNDEEFHYSPLKLREYMMCGKPAVVPRAGEMTWLFTDGVDCVHYRAGDVDGLAQGMLSLHADRERAKRIGNAGAQVIARNGTWDIRLSEVLSSMGVS